MRPVAELGRWRSRRVLRRLLPPGADSLVLVLGGRPQDADRLLRGTQWADADRVTVRIGPVRRLKRRISRLPPLGLVLDLGASRGPGQLRRYRALSPHLNRGGAWVATRSSTPGDGPEPMAERFGVARGPVVVPQRQQYLLKVTPDTAAATLIPSREPRLDVEVLDSRPPGVLTATARSVDHGAQPDPRVPSALPYPALQLRRYRGPLTLYDGAVVTADRSVLPDSFRWHLTKEPANSTLKPIRRDFAVVRPGRRRGPVTAVHGPHFFLDYVQYPHYGHLMTEALSKMWAWPAAKELIPDLKLLIRAHPVVANEDRPEFDLLPRLGVAPDDIAWVSGVCRVEDLVAATPMWHNAPPFYVHPEMAETWRRLRDSYAPDVTSGPERIFVTRYRGNRICRNVGEVEQLFESHGYTVIHPGLMPRAEQAQVFARARVIAGFGGTGMFNLGFAQNLESVVVLNHTSYDARNEHLFAAMHDVPAHYFWSRADIAPDSPAGIYAARQSSWSFDFEANHDLHDVLDQL